jgi:hypothetical protein
MMGCHIEWNTTDFYGTKNGEGKRPPNTTNIQPILWQPPGIIKINWNAGLNKVNGRVALQMIAYDCKGLVVAAHCITLQHVMEPIAAETMAALYATIFSGEIGFF